MKWIKMESPFYVRETLPKDETCLVLWKGIVALCDWDDDIDGFYLSMMPSAYDVMRLSREREGKITHWCKLELPEDY